jgi:hypothetical protein
MAVWQPDRVTEEVVREAAAQARRRRLAALDRVRLARFAEGTCVQVLHVGPDDAEAPVLARMHEQYLPEHGLTFNGPHHEVYLSDPRRTDPARLRTVLRQPVRPLEQRP